MYAVLNGEQIPPVAADVAVIPLLAHHGAWFALGNGSRHWILQPIPIFEEGCHFQTAGAPERSCVALVDAAGIFCP